MRLIDGDELLTAFPVDDEPILTKSCVRMTIQRMPTVDAIPVAHSEWVPKEKADTPYGLEMECAKCGFSVIVNDALCFNFCPNCGAKMNEEDNGQTD